MSDDKDEGSNLVEQILQLQSEASRKREWLERLQEKKNTLKDELDARKNDVAQLDNDIQTLSRKENEHKNRHPSNMQDEAVNNHIRDSIRRMLNSRIPAFKADDMKEEDSDDSDDEAAEDQQEDKGNSHGSVIVTYMNANAQEPNKLDEYRVSYRLDRGVGGGGTTVEMLHADACEYWGCSKSEFRLCKPEKDGWFSDIKLPEESDTLVSKILDKRTHKDIQSGNSVWRSVASPIDIDEFLKKSAEAEDAAMASMRHGKAQDAKEEDHFAVAFVKWPGIFNLLKYKPKPLLKKWSHIKSRDFLMYAVLILLTGLAILSRSNTQYYWLRQGVYETLQEGVPGESPDSQAFPVISFRDVRQFEDIWRFVRGSFRYQLFDQSSRLRQFYRPVTMLRVRQQKAKRKKCRRDEVPESQRGGPCYDVRVGFSADDQDTEVLITDPSYWIDTETDPSLLGRLPSPDPREWLAGRKDNVELTGVLQYAYDGSGFTVDYNCSNPNASSTFDADMTVFREHWLNTQTRLFALEVTLGNFNLGGFVSCTFMFEISPSGAVNPTNHLIPLDIGGDVDGGGFGVALLIIRGLIVLYILTVQVYAETNYKAASGKSGLQYIFSVVGALDMITVSLFCAMGYMRFKYDPPTPIGMTSFYSYSCDAWFGEALLSAEGIFIVLVLARFISFARLNPSVNQYWKMYGRACWMFMYWMAVFLPIFFGFVMLAHCVWSPGLQEFSTWWQTIVSLIIYIRQDFNVRDMYMKAPTWTIPFIVFYFLAVSCFLVNGFLAITIHAYFQTQLTDGITKDGKSWTTDQWMDWALAGPLYRCIFRRKPGSSRRDDGADEGDGGEDSSSEDDDDEKE